MKTKNLFYITSLFIIMSCSLNKVYSQATSAVGTNMPVGGGNFLGWAPAAGIPLDIRHDGGLDIDFYTGGIALANRRIKILGATGHVGIGNGFAPGFRLDVWDDINIAPQAANFINNGYRIGTNLVLYLPGDPSGWNNTFVGRSGNISAAPGYNNTYLGFDAGLNTSLSNYENVFIGGNAGKITPDFTKWNSFMGFGAGELAFRPSGCTYIGYQAGYTPNFPLVTASDFNTYIGYQSGYSDAGSGLNSFLGKWSGYSISSGKRNTFLGVDAGYSNSTANDNTFAGYQSGYTNSAGTMNAFLGTESGLTNNANYNTFIGARSGRTNAAGIENTFAGYESGFSNTVSGNTFLGAYSGRQNSGVQNTYVGWNSGRNSTIHGDNTFVGYDCASQNVNAEANTFVGSLAARLNQGSYNSFVGHQAGAQQLNASYNTFMGMLSGLWNQSNQNCFFGDFSGEFHNTGDYNTYIGSRAQFVPTLITDQENNLTNSAAIGANTIVPFDDQMILGDNNVNVGIGLSGDFTTNGNDGPQNKLEINAINSPAPNVDDLVPNLCGGGASGFSGLRFRDLTSASAPCTPNGKVLTVDTKGDVILVPDNGGLGFGLCPAPTSLTGDAGVNFNEFNFHFVDPAFPPATRNNSLVIGFTGCYPLPVSAKVEVFSSTTTTPNYNFTHRIAGRFHEAGDYSSPPASGGDEFVGVYGDCDVRDIAPLFGTKRTNLGGDFYATQTVTNIGARGTAYGASLAFNIGLNGVAINGPTNFAVYGDLGPAVIPCPPSPPNPPCFNATAPNAAGYFNGDIVTTTGMYSISDSSLKQNIQVLGNTMGIINQLNPKSYSFNQQANQSLILASNNIHAGLMAQDVEGVLPGVVKNCIHPARYDSLGNQTHAAINYKAINYTELIPYLIAGMKEQQTQIETLENLVEELSNPLLAPPQGNDDTGNSINNINITLSSKTIVLNQNDPNPFKEQTTIEYFIPDDAQQVKIIFTDMKGDVLKEVDVTEKGKGLLNVYAADLSSGIYTYTIVANGVTIDSKRMLKTK